MALDPVLVENTSAWLRKAEEDLQRVERSLSTDPPDVEDALFHSRQAAEKALKAFLTWHDQPFRKTHDLDALGRQCVEVDSTLESLVDGADQLTEYAWVSRYPMRAAEPTLADIEEGRTVAR